jgi:CDP-diacylglycerol--serine O-phosphatidyltransferase
MGSLKYLIPNGFTALSMIFGFTSILSSASGDFHLAAWMITWGVLLDKLDGSAARLFNASSEFGVQFDSFADSVIFGIAPASLFYFWVSADPQAARWGALSVYGLLGASAYLVMTTCRLARFNISEPPGGDRFFYGLPTTLSGAILSTGYLTLEAYAQSKGGPLPDLPHLEGSALSCGLVIILTMSALMVSPFLLPKLKPRKSLPVNIFQFANVIAAYILAPMMLFPEYLLSLCLIYVVVGFSHGALVGLGEPSDEAHEREALSEQ